MRETYERHLKQLQRNLGHLLLQAASYGGEQFSPLFLVNQINATKEYIAKTEDILSRDIYDDLPAYKYFKQGIHEHLLGNLWEARRYYKMTLDEDPFYPQAEEKLALVERQIANESLPPINGSPPRAQRRVGFPINPKVALVLLLVVTLCIIVWAAVRREELRNKHSHIVPSRCLGMGSCSIARFEADWDNNGKRYAYHWKSTL